MKKDKFLKELRKRLIVLDEQEVEDIMEEYQDHIKNKMDSGLSEEDAIKDFGDIDLLAKEILKAYKINENYNRKPHLEEEVDNIIGKATNFFQELIDIFTKNKEQDLPSIIIKIILILIIVSALNIPFYIFEEVGADLLSVFPSVTSSIIFVIGKVTLKILSIGISVFLLYWLLKRYIIDEYKIKDETIKQNETIKSEPKASTKKRVAKSEQSSYEAPSILTTIFKILVILSSIPFILILVVLAVILGFLVSFAIQGIYLISLFLIIIGLITIIGSIIGVIFHVAKELK